MAFRIKPNKILSHLSGVNAFRSELQPNLGFAVTSGSILIGEMTKTLS